MLTRGEEIGEYSDSETGQPTVRPAFPTRPPDEKSRDSGGVPPHRVPFYRRCGDRHDDDALGDEDRRARPGHQMHHQDDEIGGDERRHRRNGQPPIARSFDGHGAAAIWGHPDKKGVYPPLEPARPDDCPQRSVECGHGRQRRPVLPCQASCVPWKVVVGGFGSPLCLYSATSRFFSIAICAPRAFVSTPAFFACANMFPCFFSSSLT